MTGSWDPPGHEASGAPPAAPATSGRSAPTLDGAIGASSGLLLGIGVVVLVNDGWDRLATAICGAVLTALGIAATLMLAEAWRAPRSAAVAVGAIGIAALAAAIPSPSSESFVRSMLLLATVGYGVAWSAPGFRRHRVMLTIGLLTAAGLLADLAGGRATPEELGLIPVGRYSSGGEGEVLLLIGLAYVLAMRAFDRRADPSNGTTFAVAGLVATGVAGTSLAFAFEDRSGSLLLVAVVGAVVCILGAASRRRATTWWGAALCVLGSTWLALSLADLTSPRWGGFAVAVTGVLLLGGATLAGWRRRFSVGSVARR